VSDQGWFGPDSVAWRLHSDATMLVAAMRALMVQALEPRAMAGVAQHSDYQRDPWGRLDRTVRFILNTTYGDSDTAEAAVGTVRKIHEHVRGIDPTTGRAYSAGDPDLLLWIHAVEVHSVVHCYRRYGGGLSDTDADRYVVEMGRVAQELGLPAAMTPASMGELRHYLDGMDGSLQITPAARSALRTILVPPLPLALTLLRPLALIPTTAAIATLPAVARRLYGLPWFPPATPPLRAGVFALTRVLNFVVPEAPEVRAARARTRAA